MTDFEIIGMLKTYVKNSIEGAGALEGAPCQIQSIVHDNGANVVTFLWKDNEGTDHTSVMTVPDGETGATGATGATGNGIASITKTGTEGLVDTYTITYTNGNTTTFTVTNGDFAAFTGATSQAAGSKGAVPAPATTEAEKLLCGDGTWTDNTITDAQWTQIQSILA